MRNTKLELVKELRAERIKHIETLIKLKDAHEEHLATLERPFYRVPQFYLGWLYGWCICGFLMSILMWLVCQ